MPATAALPRWDIDSIFPGLESPEFQAELSRLAGDIADLESLLVTTGIEEASAADPVESWEAFESAYSALHERMRTVSTYVHMHVTTDSRNEAAQARESELQQLGIRLRKIDTKVTAWIGKLDLESLIAASASAKVHEYYLRTSQVYAAKLMSPAEEDLAAELRESGGAAWAKLQGNLSSQIEVEVVGRRLPMPAARNLAYDPDADVRREAYQAELDAWKKNEVAIAAAMNSIKGEFGRLSKRRGWASPLDQALFDARIDRAALDAMLGAARKSFPALRRYLRAKARLLGKERLPWYDLFAPLPGAGREWPWETAEKFVEEQFRGYSDKLGDFARMSFDRTWTDAEPRIGKRDGAYCISLRPGESRILMNFKPAFGSVSTLAHELGHAYHNLCFKDRMPLQRSSPMTLAETASIFCETLIRQAGLREGTEAEKLEILEASLQGSIQVVIDITSRFLYESEVFERRSERELSAREHCEIMLRAQEQTYGDGLDGEVLHPYMWAVKPHYYSPARSFYNFPYMFGLLFGLGLFAIYEGDPDSFRERYDDLLSSTGMFDAAELAARFGIDIRQESFWAGSLSVIESDVQKFEELTA
jgi:pepF/M3 family oligoendopeptidase